MNAITQAGAGNFQGNDCKLAKGYEKKKESKVKNKAATLCRDVLRSTPTLYCHVNPSTYQASHSPAPPLHHHHHHFHPPPLTSKKNPALKPWCSIVCTRSQLVKSSLSTLLRHHDFAQSCARSFVGDTFLFSVRNADPQR